MKQVKNNQVLPLGSNLSKLKRTSGALALTSWNNNQIDEDILSHDEEANLTHKLQRSQREETILSPTLKKLELEDEYNKFNEHANDDDKLVAGDQKSMAGSMLIFDKINEKSRNTKLERANSKQITSNLEQAEKLENKKMENNTATGSFPFEKAKKILFKQNSVVMSDKMFSPKDEEESNDKVSMSIHSLQNQNALIEPAISKSSGNILSFNQQKSHFAMLLQKHKLAISKSGTINHNKDSNTLFRNSTTKEQVKFMGSLLPQASILKKKKTLMDKLYTGGWNIMGKVFIILRFMKQLKRSSIYYNFHNLKSMHFQIIGDKAYIGKEEKENILKQNIVTNCLKSILPNIKKITNAIKVFQPDNIWVLIFYNVIILSLTIFTAFFELIISSFNGYNDVEIVTSGYAVFRKVTGAILILEILIRFNTGTYKEGIIIFSRDIIFKNYSRLQFFWIDLILTLDIFWNLDNYIVSLVVFLFRCIKIGRLSQDLNDHFRIWYRFPTGWIMSRLFFMIIILAHFWGCQFHYIGRLEDEAGMNNWMVKQQLVNDHWYIKYINSFYFTTISMVTIGYGDIAPVTTIEKCYCTFVAVLGSCFFSYIVNTIGSIFQEISNKEAAIKQQKNNISDYMAKRDINQKLQLKVIKYLDYTHTRQGDGPLKGQLILNNIAKNLREEVQIEYFGNILQNTRVFQNNFSSDCLRALSLKLKEVMYGPGEVIFHKGELDYKIFFIQSGEVSLFLEKEGGEIFEMAKLSKGQYFGQFGFFGCKPREIAVKCCDITHLVYLENEDFISVIKNHQEDYEKYYMMKDEINFKDKKLSTRCSSCGAYDHTIVDCSLVTPHFNKFRIMIKYIYPVSQTRQAVIRERSKFHTYQQNYNVREDLKKVRNNLALKFMQDDGEIDEVSDENEYSEEQQNHPMDDKDYFMKQKMQFRYVDGEIINYESENTHNYITDENQSMTVDQMNQTNQTNYNLGSQGTLQLKDSGISQTDSVPEIIVQRKDMKQLSIIKNNFNPYMRQNSTVQKQSLFRMESLAALSSDVQKDNTPSKEIGGVPYQTSSNQVSGGFASASGMTPRQNQTIYDNTNYSDQKSQNYYTQGMYDNTSNVNSVNQNATPRQGLTAAAIGGGYLTQQNIPIVPNTIDSTPQKSLDQSIDENKNQSTAPQVNQFSNESKKSQIHEQLQHVKEKLLLQKDKSKKKKNKIPKMRKKKVSIQIEGELMSEEDSSSNSYLEEYDVEEDEVINIDDYNSLNKSWVSDNQQHQMVTPPLKSYNSKHKNTDNQEHNREDQKQELENMQPLQINITRKDSEEEEDNNVPISLAEIVKEKLNKKIMSYQGEKIIERKSEQSMQDIEGSSMTFVNHQLLTQQRSSNTNNQSQFRQSSQSIATIQEEKKEDLKIDMNSLHQYEGQQSSPSFPQQKYKTSNFFGFNQQNTETEQSQDQEALGPVLSPPKLQLSSSDHDKDEELHDEEHSEKLNTTEVADEVVENEQQQHQISSNTSPVKTPTHRRVTVYAEQIFGEQIPTNSQESGQDNYQSQSNQKSDQINSAENDDVKIEDIIDNNTHQEIIPSQLQQGVMKSKNNFLNIDMGQLAPVQEIVTKNSQDDDNTSPEYGQHMSRRNSSRSDQIKALPPPQMIKSNSQNPKPAEIKQTISYITPPQENQQIGSKSEQEPQIPYKKNNGILVNSSNQGSQNDQQSQYSYSSGNNHQQNPITNNFWPKEAMGTMSQLQKQRSLSFMPGANFNSTNDMRKLIAYNRANSKPFLQQDESYGQSNSNNQKQYHPMHASKKVTKNNTNQSQNQGQATNSPSNQVSSSKRNIVYPPTADSFSQQVMYHQKYFQGRNMKTKNSVLIQQQPGYYDNNGIGSNTPKKKQGTMISRFKGQQQSNNYSQIGGSNSMQNSFANATRNRITSYSNNNTHNPNVPTNKPDSQTNLPDDYDDELIEYEIVSNADLYIYDFDTMKEYKKYYPQHNYKKVLTDCLRQRKPFISNKSIHNNPFIQKLVNKKKKIPRRLPSLIRQYDNDKKE